MCQDCDIMFSDGAAAGHSQEYIYKLCLNYDHDQPLFPDLFISQCSICSKDYNLTSMFVFELFTKWTLSSGITSWSQ